ncbi:MAG: AMP-binding protein, partial [Mucinivorans sp.]
MIKENFIELYENCFREHWKLPALTDYFKKETFTYGEMASEIAKLHILFAELKIKRGDKIAILGRNNTRWCISTLGAITYGAVAVPILQDFNANDVQHIINHSGSRILFAGDRFFDYIDPEQTPAIEAVFSLTDFSNVWIREKAFARTCERSNIERLFTRKHPKGMQANHIKYIHTPNTETMLINYTSGTTGFSKGVMLSGNSLCGNVLFGRSIKMHFVGSRALSFLPLAHAYGCAFDFLHPLMMGSHVTLLGKIPSPKVLIEALKDVRPHIIFMVPLIIEKLYKKQIIPKMDKMLTRLALRIPT